ncbi:hypothetical protein TRFO_13079 [Tritrichomonas foetus]|uniref:Uncharacterized protein n=1 Tax=Tritrichomonas foetus TaxID=1144522 RepID=A0A1J4KZG5_9EUKA|nr:hypothetical protein TRFO_13079 [Tritrichomonas foetus]|eukprot:OHT16649.1 hypothetical protein TRFO_13079 [Tritrichomonas foetus]
MDSESNERLIDDSDPNLSLSSTLLEESEFSRFQNDNNALITENQSLRNQLDRALKFTEEIEKVNAKNSLLLTQLQETKLKVDGYQQKLRISQQKNQDLEEKNREQSFLYQQLNKQKLEIQNQLKETILKIKQAEDKITILNNQGNNYLLEKEKFLKELNDLFNTNYTSFEQLITYIENDRKERENKNTAQIQSQTEQINEYSKKILNFQSQLQENKTLVSGLKKKCARISQKCSDLKEELNNIKKENENLKVTCSDQTTKLQILVKQSETDKEHEQSLQNIINQLHEDRKDEIEKFEQMIKSKDERIRELQERLTNPSNDEDKEYLKLIQELGTLKAENSDLNQKLKLQTENSNKYKSKAIFAAKKLQQYQSGNTELSKKINHLSSLYKQNDKELGNIKDQLDKSAEINKKLEREKELLESQVKALSTFRQDESSDYSPLEKNDDKMKYISTFDKFENLINQQKDEISLLSNERRKFVNIIQTQTQMLSLYELLSKNQDQKIIQLLNKIKNKTPEPQILNILTSLIFPHINSNLQQKINNILNEKTIQPSLKLQLVCKEIGIMLNSNEKGSIFNTDSLIKSISLIVDHKYSKESLVDLVTTHFENKYCSPNSLFAGSLDNRIKSMNKLIEGELTTQQLVDLLTIQIIINVKEDEEINKLNDQVNSMSSLVEDFKYHFGSQQAIEISNKIDNYKQKIKKLKKSRNNISDDQFNKQNEKVQNLEDNMRTLVNDATVLQTQLEIKTSQLESLQKNYEKLQIESSQIKSKHIEELHRYEESLEKRNQELKNLTIKISKISIENEEKNKTLQKSNDELMQNLTVKEEKYQNTVRLLQEKIQQLHSSLSQQEQSKKAEIIQLVKIQNELKTKLRESIKVMKEQVEENQILSNKFQESITVNENQTKMMNEEMNKLVLAKKAIELQLQSVKEQAKREIDVLNSQFSFKSLATETKYKEELNSIKTKLTNEKNSIILTFLEEFDELNNFEVDEVNSVNFQMAIKDIARKYRSMNYQSIC